MEKEILKLFIKENKLRFSQINKSLKERSNKTSYHIKNLLKKGDLEKNNGNYYLTKETESDIPYFGNKKSPLPIIIIHLGNNEKTYLIKRETRPFKNKLGLPGGRLINGETIPKAVKRIMKDKFKINASLIKINSLSLEQVKNGKRNIHNFLLIFVTATTKDNIKLINIEKNEKNMIKSDYKLLKKDLSSEIKVKLVSSKS